MLLERLVVELDSDLKGLRDITAGAARMERNVQRSMTRAGQSADAFGRRVQDAGAKLTLGLSLPLAGLGLATVVVAGKMDQLRRGLDSVTGSSRETARQLVRLREVSKLPGLGFEEAIQGSINLQAAGFSAALAERALKGFGNALASVGRGRTELQGVIMALGQIASKGKISAEEINQLAERVPQIRKVMEAAFGTANTEQLQRMKIDAVTFVEGVVRELEKLDAVSTGVANAFENTTDQAKNTAASYGDRLIPATTGLLGATTGALGVLERMPPALKDLTIGAGAAAAAIGPLALGTAALIKFGPALTAAWAPLVAVGGPILAAAAAFGAVTAAGLAVANNWRTLRYEAGQLGRAIRGIPSSALDWLRRGRVADGGPGWARARERERFTPPPEIGLGTFSTSVRNDLAVMSGVMEQVRAFRGSLDDVAVGGWSAAGFQATAQSVAMLLERQKALTEEAAKISLDVTLAKGTDEAEKLEEKLAGVYEELRRVGRLLDTDMGQVWSKLQGFIAGNELQGPGSWLLDGRGFGNRDASGRLDLIGSRTEWKLVLDPKTGLQTWKRITENGIPITMPKVVPLTRPSSGTGADAANWLDDLKGFFQGIAGDAGRLLDPTLIASNLASQGIGALSSWVFGSVGSMLFGGDGNREAMREQARQLSLNSERLAELRAGIGSLDRALLGERGTDITGVTKALDMWLNPSKRGGFVPAGGSLQDWLRHFGVSMEDLTRLAERFGIELNGSTTSFQQLQEALESDFLRQLTSTFAVTFGLLRQEFDLLDITDPMEKFGRSIDLVAGLVSDDLAATLRGLTPESLDAFIGEFLGEIRAGNLAVFDQLGQLSVDQFLEFLGFAESSLDQLGDAANKATEALRNTPAGFKVALARFNASDPESNRVAPLVTTGGGGSVATGIRGAVADALAAMPGAGATFTGPIYVTADDPMEFIEKLEASTQWRQRTGAYVIPTTTRRG